jgi:GTP-binding protein
VEEADSILFLVDVRTGISHMDEAIARLLRKSSKPVLLVANKVDTHDKDGDAAEFYSLGLGEVHRISAQSGAGTGDLLDLLVSGFKKPTEEERDELPRFAIVGKPNVGKSSLVNALLGQERNIVTPIAGTTRDTVNTKFNAFGFNAWLLDTAGIRKKTKVDEDIEFYSVLRSVRSIEESDVCLLLIDAQDGMDHQSLHIFSMIERNGKGVVIVVNKWDLLEKDTNAAKRYEEEIRKRTAPFTDLPIVFTSVTEKQRIHRAMELGMKVFEARKQRIATRKLNDVMLPEIERLPPPMYKSKSVSIKYVTQLPGTVPAFAFFTNLPQYVKDSYTRFLENKLREHFDFHGVPVRVFYRKK